MPLVLAIEPDPRQAATLKRVVRAAVRAKLVVVDSKDAALAAIAASVPDLILVTALMPPRDEDDLTRHLNALDNAGHLQTLTIPMFAAAARDEKIGGRVFGGLRRKKRAPALDGCDPKVFGEQIEAYLQRAAELREEQRAHEQAAPLEPAIVRDVAAEEPGPAAFGHSIAEQEFNPAPLEERVPIYQPPAAVIEDAQPAAEEPTPLAFDARPAAIEESVFVRPPAVVEEASTTALDGESQVEQDFGLFAAPAIVEEPAGVEPDFIPARAEPALVQQDFSPLAEPSVIEHASTVEQGFGPALADHARVGQDSTPLAEPAVTDEPSTVEHAFSPALAAPAQEEQPETDGLDDNSAEWQVVPLEDQASDAPAGAELTIVDSTPEQQQDAIERAVDTNAASAAENGPGFVLTPPLAASIEAESVETERDAPADGYEQLALAPAADEVSVPQVAAQHEVADAEIAATRAASARVVHTAFAHALGNLHAFVARVGSGRKSRGPAPILDIAGAAAPTEESRAGAAGPDSGTASTENRLPEAAPLAATAHEQATIEMAAADGVALREDSARGESRGGEGRVLAEPREAAGVAAADNEPRAAVHAVVEVTAIEAQEPRAAAAAESASPDEAGTPRDADAKKKRRRRRRIEAKRPVPDLEMALAGVESRWLASAIAALRVDIQQLRDETRTVAAVTNAFGQVPLAAAAAAPEPSAAPSGNGNGNGHGNGNGNGHGKANGNGNGKGHGQGQATTADPAPIQDEWGFYNPERCGMQALMAKLEEGDAAPASTAAAPATAAAVTAREPNAAAEALDEANWRQFAADDGGQGTAPTASGAPRTGSLPKRLAPLAMWARAGDTHYRPEDILPDDDHAVIASPTTTRLPDEVRAVRYGSGCRIRRVRVAPGPKQPAGARRQVVILSKKVLDDLR